MGWIQALFGKRPVQAGPPLPHLAEAVERVLALHPRLRLAKHCAERLHAAIAVSLGYIEELVASAPPPREASAAAWSSDPCIHAFFVSAGDVADIVSRSPAVRSCFEDHPFDSEIYAVLGMAVQERRMLGVTLEGECLRRDVVQTTINFSDHQVRTCESTEERLREEIVYRGIDQLAMEGLKRIAEDRSRRDRLENEIALLKTRLSLLESQGRGMHAMFDEVPAHQERLRLQARLEENERDLNSLGEKSRALEIDLDRVCEVFTEPWRHIHLETRSMRLDAMNVIRQDGDAEAGRECTFEIARIPSFSPQERAFSLIRFARADLLTPTPMFETAARLLS